MSKLIHRLRQILDTVLVLLWCQFVLLPRKKNGNNRKIVAIVLVEHLGDIVACEPVSRYLRKEEPNAYIIWFTSAPYKEIVTNFECVDQVKLICCITTWSYLRYLRIFDRVVNLHINMRLCPQCLVPIQNLDGDSSVTLYNYYNFGSILESFCRAAGLPPLNEQPVLRIPEGVCQRVDKLDLKQPYLVIHCQSNELCRNWSSGYWNELIELIKFKGLMVVEIGHRSDLNRAESHYYRDLCGGINIMESAEIIRRAHLFVGIDSGPAHLANAVGTYGIILLGRYRDFDRYLPYSGSYADSSRAKLLYSEGNVNNITVREVFSEIEHVLDKCGQVQSATKNSLNL